EQFRRGRHRAAEGPCEIPREPLGQRVRADVEVEAAMDLFDAGDEGLRVLRPIDAGGDERPRGPHLARRELAVLPADLEDSFVIPSALRTASSRSEEHTSELQSRGHLVCRLLLEKKKNVESPVLF